MLINVKIFLYWIFNLIILVACVAYIIKEDFGSFGSETINGQCNSVSTELEIFQCYAFQKFLRTFFASIQSTEMFK